MALQTKIYKTERKVMKKIYLLFLSLVLIFFLVGCQEEADFIPGSYGDWDSNYIYLGNHRIKTTGEELVPLIDSVTYDGVMYNSHIEHGIEVEGFRTVDYFIFEDRIYLILEYSNNKAFIACYNTLTKTHEVFYHFELTLPVYGFYKVFNDSFLFGGNETIIHMDYEGKIIDDDAIRYKDYQYLGNWMFKIEDGKIYKSVQGIDEFEFLFETPSKLKGLEIFLRLIDDKLYAYYLTYNGTLNNAYNIIQCDVNTKEVVTIFISDDEIMGAEVLSNDYFITYKLTNVIASFDFNEDLRLENKLYKINSNGEHKLLHTFNKKRDHLYKYEIIDHRINFTSFHYGRKSLFNSDRETKYYRWQFNTKTSIFRSGNVTRKTTKTNVLDQGITVGDYIYYIEIKNFNRFMFSEQYYYLNRYNKNTKNTETMFYINKDRHQTSVSSEAIIPLFTENTYSGSNRFIILPG